MQAFEQKALDYYGEVVINKSLIYKAGFGARSIPTYVGEWILSNFTRNGELTKESRNKIADFVSAYLPTKGQKDEVKNRLLNMETVQILDDYSVSVNLKTGFRRLRIPILDADEAYINNSIVEENELLLSSGVWGIGDLIYTPPEENKSKGQIWMRDFKPFQISNVDREYFAECRRHFTFNEWLDLLVSSMGFNTDILKTRQKMILITRIIPLIEPRVNTVELAPKGTGKSFVYDNLSRYARVVAGGKVTPAVLFHNLLKNTPGLISRYDLVVLDEVQSIRGDSAGEVIAQLKVYLESGRFSRGNTVGSAEAGFVMMGNTTVNKNRMPVHKQDGIFSEIPNFLQETAFIDRIHGLLPGWELPRVTKDTPSNFLGFKGDFFSEILHSFRSDTRFVDFVTDEMILKNCNDLRDRKAITRLATGFLKILFPDINPTKEEFIEYCVKPAVELRQRIRDELHKRDPEYSSVVIQL
jgi:ATP-dependent Lon protease